MYGKGDILSLWHTENVEECRTIQTSMYSYLLQLENNILKVGFSRVNPAPGDKLVKDALEQLELMIDSGELGGGSHLLKIDGPQSVPVAHVISHKLAHLYEAIAVLDPKIGRIGYKSYIVTVAHGSQRYQIGQIIETEDIQRESKSIKVVFCGPPQSGKSCFLSGLKQAILGKLGAPYPYVITACPDGEGSWHQDTYNNNPELAQAIRPGNKGELTLEFAQQAAQWVRNARQLINIVDVGGKISAENKLIMQEATHAVILSKDPDQFQEWEEFCHSLGLQVVAKIESKLNASEDTVYLDQLQVPLITGTVHGLSRGKVHGKTRLMIQTIADTLINLTKS